jgi:hypothetical protein
MKSKRPLILLLAIAPVAAHAALDEQQRYDAWTARFKQADLDNSGGLSTKELDKAELSNCSTRRL